MTDRVVIYTRSGTPIAEIDAVVTRSWQTRRDNEGSRATLSMSIKDRKFTREIMKWRNLVTVQSDVVEDWVGFLWFPRSWNNGVVNIGLFSAEHLFKFRMSGLNDVYEDTSGNIFLNLLKTANGREDTGINYLTPDIDPSGTIIAREYHRDNIMDAMNVLARDVDNHWWVYPDLAATPTLKLYARWQQERGSVWTTPLAEGKNLTNVVLNEEGDVANSLHVWNQPETWDDVTEGFAEDATSIGEYGLIEDGFASMNTEDLTSLNGIAQAHLTQRKQHRITINADIVKPPFPRVGDYVRVWLSRSGFFNASGVGGEVYMRVYSCAYSPNTNQLAVTLKRTDTEDEG